MVRYGSKLYIKNDWGTPEIGVESCHVQFESNRFDSHESAHLPISHSRNSMSFSTYLLAEAQNLEALKVGQVLPALNAVGLLGEARLGPLAIDLVLSPQLLDGAGTGSTGKLGDNEVGESGVSERQNVTGHDLLLLTGGTIDQDL